MPISSVSSVRSVPFLFFFLSFFLSLTSAADVMPTLHAPYTHTYIYEKRGKVLQLRREKEESKTRQRSRSACVRERNKDGDRLEAQARAALPFSGASKYETRLSRAPAKLEDGWTLSLHSFCLCYQRSREEPVSATREGGSEDGSRTEPNAQTCSRASWAVQRCSCLAKATERRFGARGGPSCQSPALKACHFDETRERRQAWREKVGLLILLLRAAFSYDTVSSEMRKQTRRRAQKKEM